MKTVLQDIFDNLEQWDERPFLDWLRENKEDLLKQESKALSLAKRQKSYDKNQQCDTSETPN